MVFISDGNEELGLHARSNLCYLIFLRHSIRSRAGTNLIFFLSKKTYFPTCVRAQHVLSTMDKELISRDTDPDLFLIGSDTDPTNY